MMPLTDDPHPVGTCSICGGAVFLLGEKTGHTPPRKEYVCGDCGATNKHWYGPVIQMTTPGAAVPADTTSAGPSVEWLPVQEMVSSGLLQEANRLFFHPRGLALAVTLDAQGRAVGISGVLCTPDREGFLLLNVNKTQAEALQKVAVTRAEARVAKLGFWIQPE